MRTISFKMDSNQTHELGKLHFDECAKDFDEDPLTAEMSEKTFEIFKEMDLINKEQECLVYINNILYRILVLELEIFHSL